MASPVGVPTVGRMKSAFGNYATGALGGLIYNVGRAIFGTGLIGSLVSPVLAGSIIKGEAGIALATVAGFMTFSGISNSGGSSAAAESTDNSEEVL